MSQLSHLKALTRNTPGASLDSLTVSESCFAAEHHMALPTSRQRSLHYQRFLELEATWREETEFVSSFSDAILHPAYQQIIGMGEVVVPILLRELEAEPEHWGWALQAITGQNPVKPEHVGDMNKIADDWVDWGLERGIL